MKVKVLVVDDAALIRDMIKRALYRHYENIEVEFAVDGLKAQSLLKVGLFDLILCDWEMPKMDGRELLDWLRGEERTADIPFVMVTSRGEKDHVMQAAQSGVSGYLTKPFTNEQLLAATTKVLKKRGKLKLAHGGAAKADAAQKPQDSLSLLMAGGSSAEKPPAKKSRDNGSISALTGNPLITAQDSGPAASPNAESAAKLKSTQVSAAKAKKRMAHLRYREHAHSCLIKEITLKEATTVLRGDDELPSILEQTVVHIADQSGESSLQLNAYVYAMTAVDRKMDSQYVNVKVIFVDEDPLKLEHLSHYIQSI